MRTPEIIAHHEHIGAHHARIAADHRQRGEMEAAEAHDRAAEANRAAAAAPFDGQAASQAARLSGMADSASYAVGWRVSVARRRMIPPRSP